LLFRLNYKQKNVFFLKYVKLTSTAESKVNFCPNLTQKFAFWLFIYSHMIPVSTKNGKRSTFGLKKIKRMNFMIFSN